MDEDELSKNSRYMSLDGGVGALMQISPMSAVVAPLTG